VNLKSVFETCLLRVMFLALSFRPLVSTALQGDKIPVTMVTGTPTLKGGD